MSFYPDSTYPVREDVAAIHAHQFEQLGSPGTWGTAAQRIAIVSEAREAGYEAGVLEKPDASPVRCRIWDCPPLRAGWCIASPSHQKTWTRISTTRQSKRVSVMLSTSE